MAAVRPQFRVEVLVIDPTDPVLGTGRARCPAATARGGRRACAAGTATAGGAADARSWRCSWPIPARRCTGAASPWLHGPGLPLRHQRPRVVHAPPRPAGPAPASRTRRPGRPRARSGPGGGAAGVPAAVLHAVDRERPQPVLQVPHQTRWRQLGRPEVEDFIAHCLLRGRARIDFRGLAPQLRLEFQYAVQCRHDQQTITAPPPVVTWAIAQAIDAGVGSLLALTEPQWRALTAGPAARRIEAFLMLRPRRRRDAARRHRLGGRVPPRRLAAAHPARPDPQRRQGPRPPQPPAIRPHHPARGCGRWPSAGPGCG